MKKIIEEIRVWLLLLSIVALVCLFISFGSMAMSNAIKVEWKCFKGNMQACIAARCGSK